MERISVMLKFSLTIYCHFFVRSPKHSVSSESSSSESSSDSSSSDNEDDKVEDRVPGSPRAPAELPPLDNEREEGELDPSPNAAVEGESGKASPQPQVKYDVMA